MQDIGLWFVKVAEIYSFKVATAAFSVKTMIKNQWFRWFRTISRSFNLVKGQWIFFFVDNLNNQMQLKYHIYEWGDVSV